MAADGPQIDHLVWGTKVLEAEVRRFAALTGVRAAAGGRHAGRGTHNALMSLGRGTYLELIAADPDDDGTSPFRAAIDTMRESRLLTFAAASGRLDELQRIGETLGLTTTGVFSMGRVTPQGQRLDWRLLTFSDHAFGPAMPFFIDWGDSVHPSTVTPGGCTLASLRARSPRAAELRAVYEAFGLQVDVEEGDTLLRAELDTPNGRVVLT